LSQELQLRSLVWESKEQELQLAMMELHSLMEGGWHWLGEARVRSPEQASQITVLALLM